MLDLARLKSPILLEGDASTAYRDPAVLYEDDIFHLFYTLVEVEADGKVFSYTTSRASSDLAHWTSERKLTPRDQTLSYSSPGNVIRFRDEWVLCLQTYPRPGYTIDQAPRYGDETARIHIMRSADLLNWSAPELLRVKGPEVPVDEMGRMIDPYLLEDKDQPGLWWCFYKQNGVSRSCSRDLGTWTYHGHTPCGENVCVIVEDDEYVMFHSPANGIGIKRSRDLVNWRDWGDLITLGQEEWPWARGRITAGAVLQVPGSPEGAKYLMFFHGSGPESEATCFDRNASIGVAWSDDLREWSWVPSEK